MCARRRVRGRGTTTPRRKPKCGCSPIRSSATNSGPVRKDLRMITVDGDSKEPVLSSGDRILIDVSLKVPVPRHLRHLGRSGARRQADRACPLTPSRPRSCSSRSTPSTTATNASPKRSASDAPSGSPKGCRARRSDSTRLHDPGGAERTAHHAVAPLRTCVILTDSIPLLGDGSDEQLAHADRGACCRTAIRPGTRQRLGWHGRYAGWPARPCGDPEPAVSGVARQLNR